MRRPVAPLVGLCVTIVGLLALPSVVSAAIREELDIRYGSSVNVAGERQPLRLDLYRPAERRRKPRPVVIWMHGGGFTFGERSYMSNFAKAFAERGYLSATISYRLVTPEQRALLGYPRAARDAQHDAQAAVRWFRRHAQRLGVDRRRIFVGGHSAGAITALEVAVSRQDAGRSGNPGFSSRVRGAISLAGLLFDTGQLTRGDAPMLLLHGDADTTVPIVGALNTCRAAREARVRCRLVAFPGGDHIVAYRRFDDMVRQSAAWIRRRL